MTSPQDEDLTHVSWKDTAFIQMYGLNEHTIMDYFSLSQFYDKSSLNEQISMQTRHQADTTLRLDKRQMTGLDYELGFAKVMPPSLFIVTKSMRRRTHVDLVAAYYIIEGTIYQAPDLHSLVSNRLTAFDETLASARHHPALGNFWSSDEKALAPPPTKPQPQPQRPQPAKDEEEAASPSSPVAPTSRRPTVETTTTRFLGDSAEDRRMADLFAGRLNDVIYGTAGDAIEGLDAWGMDDVVLVVEGQQPRAASVHARK
ncbi:hypothetical protein HKX48_000729 [Thoreauomyces humboldtii]|nr:hypothetical protein HKX48_000729 [Thoreauomyces humboldtii]